MLEIGAFIPRKTQRLEIALNRIDELIQWIEAQDLRTTESDPGFALPLRSA